MLALPDSAQDAMLASPGGASSTRSEQTAAIPNSSGFSIINPKDTTLATAGSGQTTPPGHASPQASQHNANLPPRPPAVDLTGPTNPHAPGTIVHGGFGLPDITPALLKVVTFIERPLSVRLSLYFIRELRLFYAKIVKIANISNDPNSVIISFFS